MGTNVVIANAIGRKDDEAVSKAVHTSMIVAVICGVVVALIAELLADPILRAQNISDEAVGLAILYFRIYMSGLPVILSISCLRAKTGILFFPLKKMRQTVIFRKDIF